MMTWPHVVCSLRRSSHPAIAAGLVLLGMLAVPALAQQDIQPPSPGMCAANGDVACTERFLNQGRDVNLLTSSGATLLHIAVGYNNTDVALLLLAHHADPNADDPGVKASWTPLMVAVLKHNAIVTKALLDAGADPNAQNDKGENALMLALTDDDEGSNKIFDLLLAAKANLNAVGWEGYSILSLAVRLAAVHGPDHPIMIQRVYQLLAAGADPNPTITSVSHLPLAEAADGDYGNKDLLALLLAYGADPNIRKPLLLDKIKGRRDFAELLINNGLEIDLEVADYKTALYLAVERDDLPQAKLLLELGADPNWPLSPLAVAVTKSDAEMVRLLLENGANLSNAVSFGRKILTAQQVPDPVIRKLIQDRLAPNDSESTILQRYEQGGSIVAAIKAQPTGVGADDTDHLLTYAAQYPAEPTLLIYTAIFSAAIGLTRPVPPEALQHEQIGTALYNAATSRTQLLAAAAEFNQAAQLAPWVPAYIRNSCLLYMMGGAYGRASLLCYAYHEIAPPDADAFSRLLEPYQEKAKHLEPPTTTSP